jgi:hypothetical protein
MSIRMEGYGGPAQPSPTIAQCLNGGYGWLEVKCRRCCQHPVGACPAAAQHTDLETRASAQMPIMPNASIFAARLHDQTDEAA